MLGRRVIIRGRIHVRLQQHFILCERKSYHEVSYCEPGNPKDVLKYYHPSTKNKNDIPTLEETQKTFLSVEMLHAPWNPADVNSVQGKYPSPPPASKDAVRSRNWTSARSTLDDKWTVAGTEGLGRIREVLPAGTSSDSNTINDNNYQLKVGDYVTIDLSGTGTLRSSLWVPAEHVVKVDRGAELVDSVGASAATIFQLGGTALRMLTDFVTLKPGDVIIQNAGNSGVGWFLAQLASRHDISVVSLVRRSVGEKMTKELLTKGKNVKVVAEEDILEGGGEALHQLKSDLKKLSLNGKLPRLALNAVGGESATLLMKLLDNGGTMVTYGGMSMKPVTISTSNLIFKDIKAVGYWHSRWRVQSSLEARKKMTDELVDAVLDKDVKCPPIQLFPLANIRQALEFAEKKPADGIRRKVVFDCRYHHH